MKYILPILVICLLTSCRDHGVHYTALHDTPLQLQECHTWDNLLAQPVTILNDNSRVRLAIHSADHLGIVELLCLEYNEDVQAARIALRTECNFEIDTLGPFGVFRDRAMKLRPSSVYERELAIFTGKKDAHYILHRYYLHMNSSVKGLDGSGHLMYNEQIVARWKHKMKSPSFSWFQLHDMTGIQELQDLREIDAEPMRIEARSGLRVVYPGNADENELVMTATDLQDLQRKTFPNLSYEHIQTMQVHALPNQKFLFEAHKIRDSHEFLDHLLVKVWINGVLSHGVTMGICGSSYDVDKLELSAELCPIELQVDCQKWGAQENDLVQVQFLYNIYRNDTDEQLEYLDKLSMDVECDGPGLFLSKIVTLKF